VELAIAIDIADAETVREPLPFSFGRDGMEFPLCRWFRPIGFDVTDIPAGMANDLRPAITGEIEPPRRFIIDDIKDHMALPMALFALGILVPRSILPRKSNK